MNTKKFWCHYIGNDGNTPKRRNIELTNLSELLPCISNEGAKTPLWYERDEDDYKQVHYHLYAQLTDKVAVKVRQGCLNKYDVERVLWTDEDIKLRWQKWLEDSLTEYPNMSEERKEEDRKSCERFINQDKQMRDRYQKRITAYLDYNNLLLSGELWICTATLRAYEEVQSPILSGLKELRALGLERREEEARQRREAAAKAREEEAKKKIEADRKERERLDSEAEKFKNGESIAGTDVVDLCRRYGIAIHLRTVHNLQQVIANINGKEQTCQYYRTRGKRRPQLDGCYKTATELYNYLQTA